MKFLRPLPFALLTFALPVLAHAHPGHDGDHDFVWDFGHLAQNPLASIVCFSLLVAAGWSGWKVVKARSSAKAERVRRS